MPISTYHSSLVIIESLRDGQFRSGLALTQRLTEQAPQLTAHYRRAQNADQLLAVLQEIESAPDQFGLSPIIHLEAHGLADGSGLELEDKSELEWSALYPPLARLNVASGCQLLLVVAACLGFDAIRMIARLTARAPFWAVVAPSRTAWPDELYRGFVAFYTEFVSAGNGDLAMAQLARFECGYRFLTCEQFFHWAYTAFEQQYTSETVAQEVNESLRRAQLDPGSLKTREQGIAGRRPQYFRERFAHFVMADLYPENHERFVLTYEHVQPQTASSLDSNYVQGETQTPSED